MSTQHRQVLWQDPVEAVASQLVARDVVHPLRVGIDGICGAGKSTFARALVAAVQQRGRPALWLDSDGFHHLRSRRRSGSEQARVYYENAYDFEALSRQVLVPLGRGELRIATKVHDLASDEIVTDAWTTVEADAVVVFDCTFLQRGAMRDLWDEVVWLDVDPETARARGVRRDAEAPGGASAAAAAYDERYGAACRLYLAEERPRERASIVVQG